MSEKINNDMTWPKDYKPKDGSKDNPSLTFDLISNILKNKPIDFYNNGKHTRDFTYIDDVVQGLLLILANPPKNKIPFKIFNIGNGKPQSLIKYLKFIEKFLNKKAHINNLPLQKGDVEKRGC